MASVLEVEIVNKVSNLGAFAEEKAALSSAIGGGFSPVGGGNVNFGGSFTRQEQAAAAAQMSLFATETKTAGTAAKEAASGFQTYEQKVKNAVIVSGEAGAITDGLARKMSALGNLGLSPMSLGLIAATIGVAGLVEAGKSMIENADRNEVAQKNLGQAFLTQGESLDIYQGRIDEFINQNSKFISSEYDVKDAFAAGTRAGFDFQMTTRLVNDALDLSIAKNIDLGTAMDDLIKLKTGRASQEFAAMGIQIKGAVDPVKELTKETRAATAADHAKATADRALAEEQQRLHDKSTVSANDLMTLQDLKNKDVIATKNQKDAHANLALAQKELADKGNLYAQQLDQVESKVKGARKDTSDLTQSSNELRLQWDKISNENGPGLEAMLAGVIGKTADFLDLLRNSDWGGFSNVLVTIAGGIRDVGNAIAQTNTQFEAWLKSVGVATTGGNPGGVSPHASAQSRQRGFTGTPGPATSKAGLNRKGSF